MMTENVPSASELRRLALAVVEETMGTEGTVDSKVEKCSLVIFTTETLIDLLNGMGMYDEHSQV